MTKDCDQVAVDTAFLIKIVESDNGILFEKIMKQMNRIPVIHEYVYQHEVMENRAIKGLIDKNIINIINYSDFLLEEFDKEQYERIFRQTYKGMNGQRLHEKENIFFYHRAEENLGEIHTALMALHLNIDLMVSDDNGAKNYIEKNLSSKRHKLSVQNIPDVLLSLASSDRCFLHWQDIKGIIKRLYGKNSKIYIEIRKCWQSV